MGNNLEEKVVYNTEEVSNLLGMSIYQIYRLTREGYIPHKRVGKRRIVYPKALLDQWLLEDEE